MVDDSQQHRRVSSRTPSSAMLEISHDAFGTLTLLAKDFSTGGFFVKKGAQPLPPIGTEVDVVIKRHTGVLNNQPVGMKVVHKNREGMGLTFLS